MATRITTASELQAMKNNLSGAFELGGDIDCSGIGNFEPIGLWNGQGNFIGSLDGKNYRIYNLVVDRITDDYIGLFGKIDGAAISNLRVEGEFTGDANVGGLAGDIDDSVVTNCSTDVRVVADVGLAGGFAGLIYGGSIITDCHSEGTLDEGAAASSAYGGFAGWKGMASVISRSQSTVTVTAPSASSVGGFVGYSSEAAFSRCFASGAVYARSDAGGFIGVGGWGNVTTTIEDCYARGAVRTVLGGASGFCSRNTSFSGSALIIRNSYGTGAVSSDAGSGSDYVAGFFYSKQSGTVIVSNCFWDRESTGVNNSLYGTSKSTAQMKTKATFTGAGWNFSSIWAMEDDINDGYPFFRGSIYSYVMTAGNFAVVETRLHWMTTNSIERYIQGILIGVSAQARGNVAVVEERIQYVGAYGNEYYWQGIEIGVSTIPAGNIAAVESRIQYVDTSGKERYIKGISV